MEGAALNATTDTSFALPPPVDLETPPVLKALVAAHRALAELKGFAGAVPGRSVLQGALSLQEAKASSEIENIIATQDEIFQAGTDPDDAPSAAAREVILHRAALELGFDRMRDKDGIITNNTLVDMFRLLKERSDGFRVVPGAVISNSLTGEVIYTPPQDASDIKALMTELEHFINEDEACGLDPLIKMALIHYQFESIHPFPDGNGRTGRMLNGLYLVRTGLLETPLLGLSLYIARNQSDYYHLLREVRTSGGAPVVWEEWVLYMLRGVADAAQTTLGLVEGIRDQMAGVKHRMRDELPRIYSRGLLNNLFRHPYTRIEYVKSDLDVARPTAAKYLDALAEKNFVKKLRHGRSNYYVNKDLVRLFKYVSGV